MKTKTLGWVVGLGALGCSMASCSQPPIECQVELALNYPYVATYTVKGATPTCSIPGFVQKGDLIGMEFYHPPTADKSTYDGTKSTVAIEADWLGNVQAAYTGYSCPVAACAPDDCGPVEDGCGGLALGGADGMTPDCGTCVNGLACGAGGKAHKCACVPKTCADLGYACGPAPDGCGGLAKADDGTTDCGKCDAGQACGAGTTDSPGAPGVCGTGTCTPKTCADLKFNCGPADDGCGKMLDCGTCTATGETCGGGGTPSVCGSPTPCVPTTCQALGYNCGPASDGCGKMLDCGSCTDPDTCGGNGILNVCGHLVLDADTSHEPYSSGRFVSTSPDGANMCKTADLLSAEQNFGSGPMTTGAFPTVNVDAKYDWSNLNVYVTADAQGTQFSADVHVKETLNGETCEIDYHVIGVWPAVDCTVQDDDGNVVPDAMGNAQANPDACNPCSDPAKGRDIGSGLNQAFPISCQKIFDETDAFGRHPYWCALKGTTDPPQLQTPVVCGE